MPITYIGRPGDCGASSNQLHKVATKLVGATREPIAVVLTGPCAHGNEGIHAAVSHAFDDHDTGLLAAFGLTAGWLASYVDLLVAEVPMSPEQRERLLKFKKDFEEARTRFISGSSE